jgi:hypothetical protein
MTPLAMRVMRELTLPVKERTLADRGGVVPLMTDVHCFECTEIVRDAMGVAYSVAEKSGGLSVLRQRAFLPADRTWIEYSAPGGRVGIHLVRARDHAQIRLVNAATSSSWLVGSLPLMETDEDTLGVFNPVIEPADLKASMIVAYVLLAFINTPRVIGRRTHLPHAGLQRRLARALGIQGKFPLNAWTEIKLDVRPPRDESDAAPREGWLSGQKALHFVRAFLRIRLGKLELVSPHWRGDASLGIKQSRYVVVPPRDGVWPAIGGAA